MAKQKGICEECKSEYEYEYNPKYPRKYCPSCSAAKKAAYEASLNDAPAEVVRPGEPVKVSGNDSKSATMYASYAKDIFCELQSKGTTENAAAYMKLSIDLVKQARDAFL